MRHTPVVRIATWNLEGEWTPRHHLLLRSLRADVLLLTEVLNTVAIPGVTIHLTEGEMQPGRRWAAVAGCGNPAAPAGSRRSHRARRGRWPSGRVFDPAVAEQWRRSAVDRSGPGLEDD